jgi:hypothetical protein
MYAATRLFVTGLSRDQDEGNAARRNPLNLLCTEEANVSTHGEPLLVQHVAIRAPDFHAPITAGHGLPAVRPKALGRIARIVRLTDCRSVSPRYQRCTTTVSRGDLMRV